MVTTELAEELKNRVKLTASSLKQRELAALLAFSGYLEKEGNVFYLTGYRNAFPPSANDSANVGLGYSAALVTADEAVSLFTTFPVSEDAYRAEELFSGRNLVEAVSTGVRKLVPEGASIGLAGADVLPLHLYNLLVEKLSGYRLIVADEIVTGLRRTKSGYEVEALRAAAQVCEEGIEAAYEATRPGIKETGLASAAIAAALEAGAEWVTRARIYSGPTPPIRWPIVTRRRIERGDLVGIDLVGWHRGYAFDVLRFWVCGNPTPAQQELLETAAAATDTAVRGCVEGARPNAIAENVGGVIAEKGAGWSYIPMGHGIGIEVVELPYFHAGSTTPLSRNEVLAVEPIVTLKDVGTAIFEEELVVREGAPEPLTHFPKLLF
jgi:Xaa-Pro aminopeptidase